MTGATIAFLSPCGWGNLGDAAIIDALVAGARRRIPDVRIVGFTLNPADTAWRHGIEAHTCAAFSLPDYPVMEPPSDPSPGGSPSVTEPEVRSPGSARAVLRASPVPPSLRTALALALRARHEPAHLKASRRRLAGASLLIVAGGGQLDATWGGPFGHPYILWRWARLARAARVRFAVASVGTGTLGALGRRLVLGALGQASYRSYRDATSRELLRAPTLTRDDPIVPDLAYALPVRPAPPPGGERLVVGISPMNYRHPKHWPKADAAVYRHHVASFGELAARLLTRGRDIVVFTTDRDHAATRDLLAAIGELGPEERSRLKVASTDTVPALLDTLAGVDVVVAARLHGVLLAHVAGRPVLAVAHERKVRTLMQDAGLDRWCAGIDAGAERVDGLLEDLLAQRDAVRAQVVEYAESCRRRVESQLDELFGRGAASDAVPPSRDSGPRSA